MTTGIAIFMAIIVTIMGRSERQKASHDKAPTVPGHGLRLRQNSSANAARHSSAKSKVGKVENRAAEDCASYFMRQRLRPGQFGLRAIDLWRIARICDVAQAKSAIGLSER